MTATDHLLELPTLALDEIHTHPSNPRRDAVADTEMVESIIAQGILTPLMVAPAPDGDGWVLIDGHRRESGARQAGLARVPVNPRYDLVTESQQLEVMVVTGLQQEHLSPVEEAAAYEQLALLGMDDVAIAKATGFSRRRVQSRLKLNDLSDDLRTGIHDGQITLTDIESLAEFADHPDAVAELEEVIGTPQFRSTYHSLRSRIDRRIETAKAVEALLLLGGRRIESVPGGMGQVVLVSDDGKQILDEKFDKVRTVRQLPAPLDDVTAHDGCLGWQLGSYNYATPEPYCLDLTRHPELTETTLAPAPESDWEQRRAAREAEEARLAGADEARREWMTTHLTGMFPTKTHQGLAAFARAFLAADGSDDEAGPNEPPTRVLARFAEDLVDRAAHYFAAPAWLGADQVLPRLQMWDWLTGAGYPMSEVDVEIRARLESKLVEAADEAS